MNYILLAIILIIAIAIIYYIWFSKDNNLTGFWIGNPAFLDKSNIFYIGADFKGDTLSLIIKPTEESSPITQIYKYQLIDGDKIEITVEDAGGVDAILPNRELTIERNKDKSQIALVDDGTTYLILSQFNSE